MVKSNQVASHPADTRLVSQSSNASALNSDATPLLRQGSGPLRRQKSVPKPKQKAAKKPSADEEAAEDQRAASKASLQLVLENWEAPNDKAAKLAHVKTHYHHELFSLSDTKTEDLAEFGQGLALYFYFLKWIAMLLAAMSVVVLPNMVWSGIARKGGTSTTGTELYDLHRWHVVLQTARPTLQLFTSISIWTHLFSHNVPAHWHITALDLCMWHTHDMLHCM